MSDPRDRSPEFPEAPDTLEAPATDEERAQAETLRLALDDPRRPSTDADLARALSSAWSPRDLPAEMHRALIRQALRGHGSRKGIQVVRLTFGAGAVIALAAAVFLLVRGEREAGTAHVTTAMAVSRSTQDLFVDRFASTGGESARVDRIAMARAADLRENEFARWGVR
jgi:hypothetical protein